MRKAPPAALEARDEEAVALLVDLGLARAAARALVYLSRVDEAVSVDVERGASLRQPEVSTAMTTLRQRGWVEKRDLRHEGRGRPVHVYRLARPLPGILDEIEREKREAAERAFENLKRLRDFAGAP